MPIDLPRRMGPLPRLVLAALAALAALAPRPVLSSDPQALHAWEPGTILALPAYLRIHAPGKILEGMGSFSVVGMDLDGKPRLSYAELGGRRYLPGDTDSLRVWDLVGIPKGRNWAFIMARGRISAFAYNPAKGVERLTLTPPDSQGWLEEGKWRGTDSFLLHFPTPGIFSLLERAEMEASHGDYVMGIRLLNLEFGEGSGERYLTFLKKAEGLCAKGKAREAEAWLDKARALDPGYSRLHYSIGRCRESQGDRPAALAAYRLALRYAGLDAGFVETLENRIQNLEYYFKVGHPESDSGGSG